MLQLQTGSKQSRRLTAANFFFYDVTLQYLDTMIAAAFGKHSLMGGTVQEGALNVRFIGRALDEDIFFPGVPLLWAKILDCPIAEFEIDIRAVPKNEKESQ